MLKRHALRPVSFFTPSLFIKRKLALQLNSLIRVSRRAHLRCLTLDKFRRFALSVIEFFSSFVHTTCTLSVSLQYLALDRGIPPILRQQSQATRLVLRYHACVPYIRGLNSVSPNVSSRNCRHCKDISATCPLGGIKLSSFSLFDRLY